MNTNASLDAATVAILHENFEGSPDVLCMLVDDFRESVDRLHQQIRKAIATGNARDMARAAHSLKSNCATMGALGMAETMREIERIGLTGQTCGCLRLLENAENSYKTLTSALDNLASSGGGSTAS